MLTKADPGIGYEHSKKALGWHSHVIRGMLFGYCLGLLLFFDFIYSNTIYDEERYSSVRVANARYHHGLAASYPGYHAWGGSHYRLSTNSLGFKDHSTRIVPLTQNNHRVLLMGDSFTEGVGFPFNETFAGLLYRAGQNSDNEVDFLNGAVASYSPVIYYKKINYLLESGLHFDEVVVFSDLSDVHDEATRYFCIDEDPQYNVYCDLETASNMQVKRNRPHLLARNFIVADRIRQTVKRAIHEWRHPTDMSYLIRSTFQVGNWTFSGSEFQWSPLEVEGGVARSLRNMQKLADLLAERRIPLTIVVYPWPNQLFYEDRESRQVEIWRSFCAKICKEFINLFPAFFAEKDAHEDWYNRLFIKGDVHFSAGGHRLMFRELAKHLL